VVNQSSSSVEDVTVRNGEVSFSTEFARDRWIIVSNSFIPGWHASIDGKGAPIHYANYIYQGILVPAGEHAVTIRYRGPYDFLYGR
ncbi:MAG: YfhO family protein, partial [Patescibacteria group bacterium]